MIITRASQYRHRVWCFLLLSATGLASSNADAKRLIEQGGVRFVHEGDVVNLVNNVTADVALLRARLDEFGDRIVVASDYARTVGQIETAIAELNAALATLKIPTG